MEEGDLFADDMRKVDKRRVERFDFAACEVFQKTAQSDEMIRLSDGLEGLIAVWQGLAVEFEAIATQKFGSNVLSFEVAI